MLLRGCKIVCTVPKFPVSTVFYLISVTENNGVYLSSLGDTYVKFDLAAIFLNYEDAVNFALNNKHFIEKSKK